MKRFDFANVAAMIIFMATVLCMIFGWDEMTYERGAYFLAMAAYLKAESVRTILQENTK